MREVGEAAAARADNHPHLENLLGTLVVDVVQAGLDGLQLLHGRNTSREHWAAGSSSVGRARKLTGGTGLPLTCTHTHKRNKNTR